MRHIRKFNENTSIDILKGLCKDYLTYLYDKKFYIEITKRNYRSIYDYYMISIYKLDFKFADIEDDLLQFIDYLKANNILLDNNAIKFVGDRTGEICLDDIKEKTRRYNNLIDTNLTNIYLIIRIT